MTMRISPNPLPAVFLVASILLPLTFASGIRPPKDCEIPEATLSPDHKLGVVVPDYEKFFRRNKELPPNILVDMASGKVLATLQGPVANLLESNTDLQPSWSQDGSTLIWAFKSKWSYRTIDVVKLEGGVVQWQVNLLERAQKEILARTQKAVPKRYAEKKAKNANDGGDFPEGYTINLKFKSPSGEPYGHMPARISNLPLSFAVTLTSDPKGLDNSPVDSRLEGKIDAEGKVTFFRFKLVKRDNQ